jgi:hypothetical protein
MENESKEIQRKGGVYRKQDFDSYVLWKSLPSFLKGQPRAVLEKFGINDDITFDLLSIKNQSEFAMRYNIKDLGTLTDWNKRIEKDGLIQSINTWARNLTPNVVLALYKNVSKNGKGRDVKVWFEIIENN